MSVDFQQVSSASCGNASHCSKELLPYVYQDLRRLALRRLRRECPGQSLQATALVHEAYLRIADIDNGNWDNPGHFFGAIAKAMRRILIDRSRQRNSQKRGGSWHRVSLEDLHTSMDQDSLNLILLDEALSKLEVLDATKAQVVNLRYFAGLTIPEVAEVLSISTSTVDNYWAYARAWLRLQIGEM